MLDQVEIVDTDYANVDTCGLCGANPLGLQRKREWIRHCLPYGLRYRTLRERTTGSSVGMIEYMPGEFAWRAVDAQSYMVIHCLQVPKKLAGQGFGSLLIQACIDDARQHKMDGVVALTTGGGWCADNRVYLRNGFEVVDRAAPSLELVVKRLREDRSPSFGPWRRRLQELGAGIYMYVSKQCPFMRGERERGRQERLRSQYGLEATIVEIDDYKAAQANPCVWGTAGTVCNGEVINYVQGGDALIWKKLRRMGVIP